MSKEAFFIYNDEIVNKMTIFDSHKLYRIHIATKKLEEVELPYAKSSVAFNPEWHYTQALGSLRAIEKFNKFIDDEADKQPPLSEADKKD